MVVFIRAVLRRSTGIIILALFRGSCSNDMEDFYSENESGSDEKDAHDR